MQKFLIAVVFFFFVLRSGQRVVWDLRNIQVHFFLLGLLMMFFTHACVLFSRTHYWILPVIAAALKEES